MHHYHLLSYLIKNLYQLNYCLNYTDHKNDLFYMNSHRAGLISYLPQSNHQIIQLFESLFLYVVILLLNLPYGWYLLWDLPTIHSLSSYAIVSGKNLVVILDRNSQMYKKIAVIQNRITAMHFTRYIYHKKFIIIHQFMDFHTPLTG